MPNMVFIGGINCKKRGELSQVGGFTLLDFSVSLWIDMVGIGCLPSPATSHLGEWSEETGGKGTGVE
jgi:hypothetical protein